MRLCISTCGLTALLLIGCGGDDSEPTSGTQGVTLSGKVTFAGIGTPIGDVEVCAPDLPAKTCATSAVDGTYTLSGVRKSQHVVFTATKAGLASALGVFDIATEDLTANVSMQELKVLVSAFAPVATLDPTKASLGILVASTADKGLTGWTAELTPDAGDGPFYGDDGGAKIDPAATASMGSGVIGFINMPAGKHTLKLTGAGSCEKNFYTVTTGDKTYETEVRAGFTTYHFVTCTP